MTGYRPDLSLPLFYLGTHRPNWLWNGSVPFPLMVSDRTLRDTARLRPATVREWSLDSGGFTELAMHGRWTVSPRDYVQRVARYDQEIGCLAWAAPQDWMCEEGIIRGGRVSPAVVAPGTGLSVRAHQELTVANYLELRDLWPEHSDTECPFIPVLQGSRPGDYETCRALYEAAGVDLGAVPLVGVGSVCRRQSGREISDIASVIGAMSMVTHWFGVKLTGIRLSCLRRGEESTPGGLLQNGPASLDSMAWSFDARRLGRRLPGCTHKAVTCSGCPAYAAQWRGKAIAALRDARDEQREWVQPALGDDDSLFAFAS